MNGLDKSGKTTQAELSKKRNGLVEIVGSLNEMNSFPKLQGKELFDWWFNDGDSDTVVKTLAKSVNERAVYASGINSPLIIVDRGDVMFDAVYAATLATREDISLQEAEMEVSLILHDERLFLKTDADVFFAQDLHNTSIRLGQEGFNKECDLLYSRYQHMLSDALLSRKNAFTHIIDAKRSIQEINDVLQNVIISKMNNVTNHGSINKVFGFSGLSESGKSSLAQYVADEHGFTRLKIKYFTDLIREKYSYQDVIDESFLASLFVKELSHFASAHYYMGDFTIESLHGFDFTKGLADALGKKFKIAYVETSADKRVLRNALALGVTESESARLIKQKDEEKNAKGVSSIHDIADVIINNDNIIEHSYMQIDSKLVNGHLKISSTRSIPKHNLPTEYEHTLSQVVEKIKSDLKEDLYLITVTGSGGRGEIIRGWSDLDLLIVTDGKTEIVLNYINDAVNDAEIKVGTTVYTKNEFESGKVDSKTKYHLELLQDGTLTPILIADELLIPNIPSEKRKQAHSVLLPNLIHGLRRSLYNKTDFDKHVAAKTISNIMKFVLSKRDLLVKGYEQTHNTFYDSFPNCPPISSVNDLMHGVDLEDYHTECCEFIDYIVDNY
ncbi:nucleotidyltransferase domain-containing protein [Candidatus Woesearchaeota archaeon]|nr:nucleotidyltransferase domain-containing protein [Candidatus Woesearchaeota archaeon]